MSEGWRRDWDACWDATGLCMHSWLLFSRGASRLHCRYLAPLRCLLIHHQTLWPASELHGQPALTAGAAPSSLELDVLRVRFC